MFTDRQFNGNALAIFADTSFDDATMQRIARELNLSETVFLSRAEGAVAALRIFTPDREVPFAGHPTVGTAIALRERLRWPGSESPSFGLKLRIGDVAISIEAADPAIAWLTTPPVAFGREIAREHAAAMASVGLADVRGDLPPQMVGAGNPFLYVPLASEAAVDRAALDVATVRAARLGRDQRRLSVRADQRRRVRAHVRSDVGHCRRSRDRERNRTVVCVSCQTRCAPSARDFSNEQGVAMGRPIDRYACGCSGDDDVPVKIEVGGSAVFVGEGRLHVRG